MNSKKIKVQATKAADGAIEFRLDGKKAKVSRINLPKDSGPHRLTFELKDHSGRGLEFDPADPIWVGEDCPCPPPKGINSDQLRVTRCESGKLIAENTNCGRERELRYQLNFTSSDGQRESCDPVITNGGGTRR